MLFQRTMLLVFLNSIFQIYGTWRIIIFLQFQKFIEMHTEDILEQWVQVNYSQANKYVPIERWGHQIVLRANHGQIYLFGGYGAYKSPDGKYFNDLWIFSIQQYTWSQIRTTGQQPETKSNYSLHYNQISDEIILFGGGSEKKVRFNTVFILNCKTRHWTRYNPEASQQAPWERTYHTSEFVYPYLIIHGGEGVTNLDLDDTWVFSVITKKWKLIEFDQDSRVPLRRRFHSSFIWNNYFYIIGGCNHHYSLIGDAHRVNLTSLFEKHEYSGFHWQCIIPHNMLLSRWGHTCSLINGKVYIAYGRISLFADSNDTIVFDLEKHEVKIHQVSRQNMPKARRRHSSVVVNDCIIIFGGYNGKYLNDFHFLKIIKNQQQNPPSTIHVQICTTFNDLESKIIELQTNMRENIQIKLTKQGKYIQSIKTNEKSIKNNMFFKHLITYAQKGCIIFEMPYFCTLLIFKILNICLNYNILLIPELKNIDFYVKLLQSCNYLNCKQIQQAVQGEIVKNINEDNYELAFKLGIQLNLNRIVHRAAEMYIQTKVQARPSPFQTNINFQSLSRLSCLGEQDELRSWEAMEAKRKTAIEHAYRNKKFIIQQAQLKELNTHFLLKTVRRIRQIFTKSAIKQNNNLHCLADQQKNNKKGCVSKIIDSIFKWCSSSPKEQNEQER